MTLKALLYAYILGGLTFIPLLIAGFIWFTIYTSIPVGELDPKKSSRNTLEEKNQQDNQDNEAQDESFPSQGDTYDIPKTRKGWLTVRRTFEDQSSDGGYVTLVRNFLDSKSKDPKRARPKDMWYVALKGTVLYLYEDESMLDCEAAIELSGHDVVIYPEGAPDAELFAKRNAISLKPKPVNPNTPVPNLDRDIAHDRDSPSGEEKEKTELLIQEEDASIDMALNPWFIFVRSNVDMEDWYLALLHASDHPPQTPTLLPLFHIFRSSHMAHLVSTLDEQPDVIPMRWFNGLLGRIFFSHYRTQALESFIIGRLMKKLSKVKTPTFLTDLAVTEVSVGNKVPMFSKPMLKELTKEGDAAMEVHVLYKGEIRITVKATALIQLGTFKSYTVKLVLAAVIREVEGNVLIKIKRPPSNRIWYAFTQTPRMVMSVEPVVSDRQITWTMILGTLESKLKEIIQESIVMPNMDDIAYYDSSPFDHRGGIWSDSGRKAEQAASVAPPLETFSSSSSSTPIIDVSPEPPEGLTETASLHSLPSMGSQSSVPTPRRRTWFSSSTDRAMTSTEEPLTAPQYDVKPPAPSPPPPPPPIDFTSGGPLNVSQSAPELPARVSQLPPEPASPPPQAVIAEESLATRSPSLKATDPQEDDRDSDTIPGTPRSLRENRNIFDQDKSRRLSGSPPGFLSTLKARATDKQTLNTAKDAMRKWGVNWAGLKKDSDSNSEGGSSIMDRARKTSSGRSSPSPATRTRYADVRAAVAERRERHTVEGQGSGETRRSQPIAIPDSTESRSRTISHGSTLSSGSGTAPLSDGALSTPAMVSTPTTPAPENLTPNPAPIHIQPQGRTMTIPGIHAKHRGEVMSMGHVASESGSPPPDGRPTMQSVYTKLWKSGSPTQEGENAHASEEGRSRKGSVSSGHKRVRQSSESSIPSSPRLTHAILPRTTATSVSRPELNASRISSDGAQKISSSETLKNIVSKDDEIRRGSLELGSGSGSPTRARQSSLSGAFLKSMKEVQKGADKSIGIT